MTKMQVAAKSTLSALGVYVIVMLCRHLSILAPTYYHDCPLTVVTTAAVLGVLIGIVIVFIIFKNGRFADKITGPGEEPSACVQTMWLATALRMAATVCGFALLSTSAGTIGSVLYWLWLGNLRIFITDLITFKTVAPALELTAKQWARAIYDFAAIILAGYFVWGAPHFIRWQLRHCVVAGRPNTKSAEKSDSHSINCERDSDE